MAERVETTDTEAAPGRGRGSRRLRVAALAMLLLLALGLLAFRYVVTSSYSESCTGVGIGPPVVTSADTDPRLIDGAATPKDALDAYLSSVVPSADGSHYFQRVDATGAPDLAAPSATADDFRFHGGSQPAYTFARGHGATTMIDLREADGTWRVTGVEACFRD